VVVAIQARVVQVAQVYLFQFLVHQLLMAVVAVVHLKQAQAAQAEQAAVVLVEAEQVGLVLMVLLILVVAVVLDLFHKATADQELLLLAMLVQQLKHQVATQSL
jgi:hypothetical protein